MTRYNERTDLTKRDLIDLARGFELLGDQLRRHAAMLEEFGRDIASVVVISALYLLSIGSFGVGILVFIGSFGVWYHARTAERLMAVLVGSGSFFVMAVLFAFAAECFLILIDIRKDIAKIVRQWSIDRREKFQKM